jgi:hypothetical protein
MTRTVAAALLAAATLAGCTTTTAGQAVPPTASPPGLGAYVSTLPDKQRETAEYNAEIRSLDPCGFVDRGSLETIGVLSAFDAAKSQQACDIEIVVDRDSDRSLEIRVAVIPNGNSYAQDAETINVAGTPVAQNIEYREGEVTAEVNQCRNLAPLDDRSVLLVQVLRRTSDAACDEANTIMAGAIPHLGERPKRQGSKFKAFHAISVADPCAALSVIGQDTKYEITDVLNSPWDCSFSVGDDYRSVGLETASRKEFDDPYSGDTFDLDGHRAVRDQLGPSCSVVVEVGDPDDGVIYTPVGDAKRITNAVQVNAGNCDDAETLASAAVKEFLG